MIDLTQDINELYNSLKKDTRYYIRKSEKEDFEFSIATEKNVFDKYMKDNPLFKGADKIQKHLKDKLEKKGKKKTKEMKKGGSCNTKKYKKGGP